MCRLPSSFLWLLPIFKTTNDATAGTSGFFSCPSPKRSQARSCQPEGDCLAISLEIFWWIMITSIEKRCLCHIAIVTLEVNCEAKSSRSSAAMALPASRAIKFVSIFLFFNAPAARKLRVLTRIFTTIFIFRQMTPSGTSGWLRKRPRKLTQEPYHLLLHALANCSDSV